MFFAVLTRALGVLYNVFEAVDVVTLIKGGVYDDLSLTVGEALKKRSPVSCISTLVNIRTTPPADLF